MKVAILFYLFVFSCIFVIGIIYRRAFLLKKLRAFVRRERISKEKQLLLELEKKGEIKKETSQKKKARFDSESKKIISKSDILISHGEYDEARKLLIALLVDDENYFEANLRLGQISLKKNQFKQAEIFFSKCLLTNKLDPKIFSDLGFCFFKNGKYKSAIESYEFALQLDANHSGRYTNLGRVFFVINEYEKARNAFLKALKINARDTEVLFMLAENYIEMKKLEKAKEVYERILEIEPYNQEASEYMNKLESRGI